MIVFWKLETFRFDTAGAFVGLSFGLWTHLEGWKSAVFFFLLQPLVVVRRKRPIRTTTRGKDQLVLIIQFELLLCACRNAVYSHFDVILSLKLSCMRSIRLIKIWVLGFFFVCDIYDPFLSLVGIDRHGSSESPLII